MSDHLVSYFKAAIKKARQPLVRYKYQHYTDKGAAKFQAWISLRDFSSMLEKQDPNEQLSDFLGSLEGAMNVCFPYKTTVRRERDPPWINRYVRAIIRKRRKVYHRESRSTKWKELMKQVRRLRGLGNTGIIRRGLSSSLLLCGPSSRTLRRTVAAKNPRGST